MFILLESVIQVFIHFAHVLHLLTWDVGGGQQSSKAAAVCSSVVLQRPAFNNAIKTLKFGNLKILP